MSGTYWRPTAASPQNKYHCWEKMAEGFESLCGLKVAADGLETNVPFTVSNERQCKVCARLKEKAA